VILTRRNSVASDVNDITIDYEEDGVLLVKELDKEILSKGAWTTIIFRFQQWDKAKEEYGKEQYTIRRYRKMGGNFSQQSKFNISSADQARKIIDALQKWTSEA